MAGSTLPTELLAGIFDHLSPSTLGVASRVCRTWKKVSFGPLHQTVYLCLAVHLDQFVQRICTEAVDSQFSIITHLRGLVLDIEYYENREDEMINESNLDSLNSIIPRLTQLEYLSWKLLFVPGDAETFRLFQTECPKLDSVDVCVYDSIDLYSAQYNMLLDFKDLSSFSLSLWDIPSRFDKDHLDPLVSLLARCPQLYSLILDFKGEFPYSPTKLVAGLGDQFVFPQLRRFYMQRSADPGWWEFFENPDSHPFLQFLRRHPGIEDLALGYVEETPYCKPIDPTDIAQLFPSLKYFEGPVFLFQPLVLSTLAGQLEKLIIVDSPLLDEVSLSKMYDRVPALPKLRKFAIWADFTEEEGILVNLLRTVVSAATQLEEIEIRPDMDSTDYNEVMKLIAQAPGLRSITLSESVLSLTSENGEELEWNTFASHLRRMCPRLQTIYRPIRKFENENREKVWEFHSDA
ncbi:unnamed protein product [Rhizoctonia solani]|uniref:F-box domain-containing protein n=1 Tax=Rhizoctonia solani TaxID=456999 RepID=A0A8H3GQC2_9AGAM|nr:unnamed protein product [Rhizoctonia solani]